MFLAAMVCATLAGTVLAGETSSSPGELDLEKGRQFWSFQPLRTITPPDVNNEGWIRTRIDRFILGPLEKQNLSPNPEASPRTLG